MRSAAGVAFAAAVILMAVAGFAGDPASPPKATKSVRQLPQRFVRQTRRVRDLAAGESSLVPPHALWLTPDGAGWVDPGVELLTKATSRGYALPTVRRNADATVEFDVTGCDPWWALTQGDGTPFVPRAGDLRVAHFLNGSDPPARVLPESFRGEFLWSLPPGTAAYVAPHRVGVDDRGEAWIDPRWPVRPESFSGSAGPAVAVTTSERDAVKIDLTGVSFRWMWSPYPTVAELKGKEGLNGHKMVPFAVTSFTVDGRVSTRMPEQFLAPRVKNLKLGESGFVDPFFVQLDPNGHAWVDPDAVADARQSLDDWDFAKVRVERVDATTCSLDLAGTTHRWCVVAHNGKRFPAELGQDNYALGVKWMKVAAVKDGAQDLGSEIPARCRAERVFEFATGTTVYTSCRYVRVDRSLAGFMPSYIPVSRTPFTDELGASAAVRIEEEDNVTVDLTGVTYVWETEDAPAFGPMPHREPGGPSVLFLKVLEFDVPDVPEPVKPPPKGPAKPPKKK